jgi:hypothetical protein
MEWSWNTFYQFYSDRYCKSMRSRTHFLRYLTVISLKLCKAWGWLAKWVETCRKKTNILWQLYNCKRYCCAWLYFSPILCTTTTTILTITTTTNTNTNTLTTAATTITTTNNNNNNSTTATTTTTLTTSTILTTTTTPVQYWKPNKHK